MRLIDADALLEELKKTYKYFDLKFYIEDAPTIEPSGDLVNRKLLIGAIEKCGEEKIYPQALIETIKALLSAETHEIRTETHGVCSNTISRADAICEVLVNDGMENIVDRINELPSADRPKGEWLDEHGDKVEFDEENGSPLHSCWCSVCGEWLVASDEYEAKGNFCPNCGAIMYKGGDPE